MQVMLLHMTSGLQVNADIPLWGVFLAILAAVGAFFALRTQMGAHEKSDDLRFAATEQMLKEIRDDVKGLLRFHGGDQ
jgi:hypothetical protein